MIITTPSLELRLQSKEQVLLEYEGMSAEDKKQVTSEWLAQIENSDSSDPWVHGFKIVLRGNGSEIGRCGFTGSLDENGVVEIAYSVDDEFRGRGYATEAAMGRSDYAAADARVRVICAHILPTENASARVLKNGGFSKTGESMDHAAGIVWRWEKPAKPDLQKS